MHKLLLTLVYGFILAIYHSRWRERLPGKLLAWIVILCLELVLWKHNFYSSFCSEACILQVCYYHVHLECNCTICLCHYWKRCFFWFLVRFFYYSVAYLKVIILNFFRLAYFSKALCFTFAHITGYIISRLYVTMPFIFPFYT